MSADKEAMGAAADGLRRALGDAMADKETAIASAAATADGLRRTIAEKERLAAAAAAAAAATMRELEEALATRQAAVATAMAKQAAEGGVTTGGVDKPEEKWKTDRE